MGMPRFFRRKLDLGMIFNRSSQNGSHHWAGSTFKSFAVIGAGNANGDPNPQFSLSLVPEPDGSTQGLPLYDGFYHNFVNPVNDAVLENLIVQPGIWVEILFSTEDMLDLGTKTKKSDLKYGNLRCGFGEAVDDGMSFIWPFTVEHTFAPSHNPCFPYSQQLYGLENAESYFTGFLTNTGGQPQFQVPAGYRLRLVSAEYDVTTAVAGGGILFGNLGVSKTNTSIVMAVQSTDNIGALFIPPAQQSIVGNGRSFIPFGDNAPSFGQDGKVFRSFVIDEGYIPIFHMVKNGTVTAGKQEIRTLWRLEKKA